MAAKKKTPTRPRPVSVAESPPEVPFEGVMKSLEGIVGRLEQGELSLEASLAAYEQGIGLVREAQSRLDAMDARLEQLTGDGRIVPIEDGGGDPSSLRQPPPAEEGEFDDDTEF